MGIEDCIGAIRDAGEGDISADEALEIMDMVRQRRDRLRQERVDLGEAELLTEAARQIGQDAEMAARIQARNAKMNLAKRLERREAYTSAPKPELGLQAKLTGANTPFRGSRLSVEAQGNALAVDWAGGVTLELEQAGLYRMVRSGQADRPIARELFELNRAEGGRPGITGDASALEAARILQRYQRVAVDAQNRAGAWIGSYDGYITRTAHDPDLIRRAGFDDWRRQIEGVLDLARTLEDVDDPDEFFRGVYRGLVTGLHLTQDGLAGAKDPAFKGPGNLAKRLSQDRTLHFRDADAWMDYFQKFGGKPLIQQHLDQLRQGARHTALMREFGTNPRAEFETDLQWLKEHFRDDIPTLDRLRKVEHGLRLQFGELDGASNMPENRQIARIGQGLRHWQGLSKLGGVLLASLGDIPAKASELRYQGIGLLEAYGDGLMSFVRGRGQGEQRGAADLLRSGLEGLLGDMVGRFDAPDTVPGTLSKLSNTFFKWSGLTRWTDSQKAGAEVLMARHLGGLADTAWPGLPEETQRILSAFRIGSDEWEALRQVDLTVAAQERAMHGGEAGPGAAAGGEDEGRRYLTPTAARMIPDAVVDRLNADRIERARDALAARAERVVTANEREADWIAGRQAKLQQIMEDARARLQRDSDRRGRKADVSEALTRDRIELLQQRIAAAEAETDILGAVRGMRTQDEVRAFLDRVEGGELATRTAARSDRSVERLANDVLRRGEGLGDRRRGLQQSIRDLEGRISETHKAAGATNDAEGAAFVDRFKTLGDELTAFTEGLRERQAGRLRAVAEAEARLPAMIERMRGEYRDDLALKVAAYFKDRADYAVIQPGARERAMLNRGLRPGTVEGEAIRLMMQFKSFPVAMITRTLGRELYGQARPAAIAGILHIIGTATVFGYLSMVAKDLAKGRNVRDPLDPATWAAAFVQGGGAGIYGDFLMGQTSRFGGGLLDTVAGPTFGSARDLKELYDRVRSGDQVAAPALRFALANTPFVNLFYTRIGLDYLFLYQVQEALNPGFLRRMERRMAKENDQTFMYPPSQAIPPGGGSRLFEGVRGP